MRSGLGEGRIDRNKGEGAVKGFDPKGQRIQREAIELGCDYGDAAARYLAEKWPAEPTLEDLETFYVGCTGSMIGMMYSAVYKAKGRDEADHWLAKVLMGIPSLVRSNGVPLLLTINADSRPMEAEPQGKQKSGLIGKVPGKCMCEPVQEGACQPCFDRMKGAIKALVTCHGSYLKAMTEATKGFWKSDCQACALKSIDPALASIIAEESLPGGPASGSQFGNQLGVFVEGLAHQLGVKELPLTEKAWADKERGAN